MDNRIKNSEVGLEVEFLLKDGINASTVKRDLQKLLKVKLKLEDEAHSDFVPTKDEYKLEKDYSGGEKTLELVTAPMDYKDARITIMLMLNWIRQNKFIETSDRTGLHLNINYPDGPYIQDIDMLKFILTFDENYVYKLFPKRLGNIYTKSIKSIIPIHNNYDFNNPNMDTSNFLYPNSKYFGVNFEKLKHNYLEFRYIGGKGYEKKQTEILDLLDHFLFSIIKSHEAEYNDDLKDELKEILSNKQRVFMAGRDYFHFKNIFKKLKLLVDTEAKEEIIKSFYPKIWSILHPLMINMKENKYNMQGTINYNTDKSTVEIQGAFIKNTTIDQAQILFIECNIVSCVIENQRLLECSVRNSDILDTNSEYTKFKRSRVKNGEHEYSDFDDCYIDGNFLTMLDGSVEGGIFRKGKYQGTRIEDNVEVIDVEEIEEDENN